MQEIYHRVQYVCVLCFDCTFSSETKLYLFKTLTSLASWTWE